MTRKFTLVSAVAAALAKSVNEPAAATAATDFMVVSFVPTVAMMMELVVTRESVTTRDVAAAAKFTVPAFLLIVCAPVVPPAVTVLSIATLWLRLIAPPVFVLPMLMVVVLLAAPAVPMLTVLVCPDAVAFVE